MILDALIFATVALGLFLALIVVGGNGSARKRTMALLYIVSVLIVALAGFLVRWLAAGGLLCAT